MASWSCCHCSPFNWCVHPRPPPGGPDGGNGGAGGNIFIVADSHNADLSFQSYHFSGPRGKHGTSALCHGRKGEDLIVRVPAGTVVREVVGDESVPLRQRETRVLADMVSPNQQLLVAQGGIGGLGNRSFRSAVRRCVRLE
jgi:GTP-binding protein